MVEFDACEYQPDGSLSMARYRYEGSTEHGWCILREGTRYLELPQGYVLLESLRCGVCATDLARRHLPFALPQVLGHEVIARNDSGRLVAAEINASHFSTGSPDADTCALCRTGLPTHCPERLVLGIDRLPGGFSPWILVPERNCVEVPEAVGLEVSVLVEPFAAALQATQRIDFQGARRVAVLGVGRIGLLIVASLRALRDAQGGSFSIETVDRRPARLEIARSFGADAAWQDLDRLGPRPGSEPPFDIVIESTGSPVGLDVAMALASREVHVKSTTGLETLGFKHLTACVVDEISLRRFDPEEIRVPPLRRDSPPSAMVVGTGISQDADARCIAAGYHVVRAASVDDIENRYSRERVIKGEQADIVLVDSLETADRVIRPWPDIERGCVRPRGMVLLVQGGQARRGLMEYIVGKNLRLSTSRCGDFRAAFPIMERLLSERIDLGRIITDDIPVTQLAEAFDRARSSSSIKVVVTHRA